jgi:hypothetical protein
MTTIGLCPSCYWRGASIETLNTPRKLVDGIVCGPCYRQAHPPAPKVRVKKVRVKEESPGKKARRAEEEELSRVISQIDKGTHFLEMAAAQLNWDLARVKLVYLRYYRKGNRRGKVLGANIETVLKDGPATLAQIKERTGLKDSSVHAGIAKLGDLISVTRNGRTRLYSLVDTDGTML